MTPPALTRLALKRFTAFSTLDVALSPGVNVFIGANGTGKTHLLKVLYSACDVTRSGDSLAAKLVRVFLPLQDRIGRLAHREPGSVTAWIRAYRGDESIRVSFSNHTKSAGAARTRGGARWSRRPSECVFLPAQEMLSHAPGFRSLYSKRDIHFDETFADVLDRAYRPLLRGPTDKPRRRLLQVIEKAIAGHVATKGEVFFLRSQQGDLEFSLLAEGMRKLALLWLLVQNGTLLRGSVLFWDEPEANLNPSVIGLIVQVVLELRRMGVQVFVATHDYFVLKELDLRKEKRDHVRFHSLFRDAASGDILWHPADHYEGIHPNAIADTFLNVYDRDVARAVGRLANGPAGR